MEWVAVFGWWADRHARKPQMVAGILVLAVVSVLPLAVTGVFQGLLLFFVLGSDVLVRYRIRVIRDEQAEAV